MDVFFTGRKVQLMEFGNAKSLCLVQQPTIVCYSRCVPVWVGQRVGSTTFVAVKVPAVQNILSGIVICAQLLVPQDHSAFLLCNIDQDFPVAPVGFGFGFGGEKIPDPEGIFSVFIFMDGYTQVGRSTDMVGGGHLRAVQQDDAGIGKILLEHHSLGLFCKPQNEPPGICIIRNTGYGTVQRDHLRIKFRVEEHPLNDAVFQNNIKLVFGREHRLDVGIKRVICQKFTTVGPDKEHALPDCTDQKFGVRSIVQRKF